MVRATVVVAHQITHPRRSPHHQIHSIHLRFVLRTSVALDPASAATTACLLGPRCRRRQSRMFHTAHSRLAYHRPVTLSVWDSLLTTEWQIKLHHLHRTSTRRTCNKYTSSTPETWEHTPKPENINHETITTVTPLHISVEQYHISSRVPVFIYFYGPAES